MTTTQTATAVHPIPTAVDAPVLSVTTTITQGRDDALVVRSTIDGDGAVVLSVEAEADLFATAVATVEFAQTFGVALFEGGVAQRDGDVARHAAPASGLIAAYATSLHGGGAVQIDGTAPSAVAEWTDGGFRVHVLLAGDATTHDAVVDGAWSPSDAIDAELLSEGSTRTVVLRLTHAVDPVPALFEDAVAFADPLDLQTHRIALWGSQVGALDTLEFAGAAYPTLHAPKRAYGSLHTFFDPDAWSSSVALAYSGIPYLQRQAEQVVERALAHLHDDGLVPHHFDGDEPDYIAISGSPQPGPNLFVVEAAIDIACATGDIGWFRDQWEGGLRRALEWLLDRIDDRHGLLDVVGALWVDVFRRAGMTLDTNAMAVRTFGRAADAARAIGDPFAQRLDEGRNTVRGHLDALWSDDHFVTSIDAEDGTVDDHLDTENYLAIAAGATTPEQSERIVALFDASPLTHPNGRGTFVSLRPYEAEDCYLGNTGDSDIAMARHWWADLLARRALGDDETFRALFEPVRADMLEMLWMTERYSVDGAMVRSEGYHEYPDLLDYLLREGMYGLSLDLGAVLIAPMRPGPLAARWGGISYAYAQDEVRLTLADDLDRAVTLRGLVPGGRYDVGGTIVTADAAGELHTSMRRDLVATLLPAEVE
ncbi:hypothetical protein ACI3KS_11200 [Microbacterium sp. ZW T5_45]|uniref:hypothetical protein n=1 Tax=Microbacterium sp. ZW T5_45 TaxID=3378080 RepID=UPI0038524466